MLKLHSLVALLLPLQFAAAAALPPEQVEFFEKKIRPILAQECYECHSTAGKKKGGLLLDSRPGWQAGGDSGEAIVPGDPEKSLLIASIRHTEADLKMPSKAPKLEDAVIRDFEAWVKMGAPDPRDRPSSPEQVALDKDWSSVLQRRKGWWAFRPIADPAVPKAGDGWAVNPLDRFLAKSMADGGLAPAADAPPHVILRRLSYVITGLAPTPEETDAFVAQIAASDLSAAIRATADRLLGSPRFGETWARHWMDWVRYADSHGSEGDPAIPYAWRYRDYLIRGLNADVAYPQLLWEHIAGDLTRKGGAPGAVGTWARVNRELGTSEGALGAAHYRMVLHGFTPTDAYDELCTFTDNQIDTVTKAFLGLTVACARCHDHKFDAISQADYFALFGIFASTRPATIDLNTPERREARAKDLARRKAELRGKLAEAWLASLDGLGERLKAWEPTPAQKLLDEKGKEKKVPPQDLGPLADWLQLRKLPVEKWPGTWAKLGERVRENAAKLQQFLAQQTGAAWDLRSRDLQQWQSEGPGVQQGPVPAGDFHVLPEGPSVLGGIYPAGTYSHLLSEKHRGLLSSPNFDCSGGKLWMRVRGEGDARVRYVVRNYPRTGTVYQRADLNSATEQWVSWDLTYWKGDTLHVEISTEADQPVETKRKERSWFGVTDVRYLPGADSIAPPPTSLSVLALCPPETPAPATEAELVGLMTKLVRTAIEHWREGKATDAEAELLNHFARLNLLPNTVAELPKAIGALVEAYRKAENEVPIPTRAPGLLEGFARDWPLLTRGDHKKPADPVPRRFLEAIDPRPFHPGERESGRVQLAERMIADSNPLTWRVIVNRVWSHVFGQGLVATPDNFGRLGELPSHPELLDFLATDFRRDGAQLKGLIRELVTSRAFRLDHRASAAAAERDPQNRLLTHFPARRLAAEAIRDSMLALTGKLETTLGGESVGPGSYRRSVYGKVMRNNLDPLLTAFDFPVPSAPRGKRDATNVPAQALTLLNDKLVEQWAADWARRIARDSGLADDAARANRMFGEAFGREATREELASAAAFVQENASEGEGADPWRALAQALFNAKEFIYLP